MTLSCLLVVGEADGRDAGATQCITQMPHVTFVS
jgi:hypothetical protein